MFPSTIDDQQVDATSVVIRYTLAGDPTLDRTVDFNDLVKLAQNYNTSGKTYADGDFTGDGNVDFNDLVILAQHYNTSLPLLGASTPVPAASFAANWTAATMPIAPKLAVTPSKKKTDSVFSVTPVAKPIFIKSKAHFCCH